jgi:hypothetical protein
MQRMRARLLSRRPLAAEHLTDSCDIGSSEHALAQRFPRLAPQVASLPPVWWYTDDETSRTDAAHSRERYRECGFMEPERTVVQRVDELAAALRARPERVIALFGHSDLFNFLMEVRAALPGGTRHASGGGANARPRAAPAPAPCDTHHLYLYLYLSHRLSRGHSSSRSVIAV